jgi:dihydropteroate synthase
VQLRKQFPNAILSVDTFHSMVANNALLEGANMINDVSAGSMDNGMWATIAKHRVPYLIMHMQGTPETMQQDPQYDHVVHTVMQFFNERIRALNALGVVDLIIDPGFGFGKTIAHNFSLLKNLSAFKMHHAILLTGLSRKSMIYQTLGTNADEALNATTALHMVALNNGAQILRTHDVKEAMETIAMYNALQAAE